MARAQMTSAKRWSVLSARSQLQQQRDRGQVVEALRLRDAGRRRQQAAARASLVAVGVISQRAELETRVVCEVPGTNVRARHFALHHRQYVPARSLRSL